MSDKSRRFLRIAATCNSMETTSSKVLARSQAASTGQRRWTSGVKSNKLDLSALLDVTNDSPIAGVATGSMKTPGCAAAKGKGKTPGSGESLLRGQVKTLLQKVEEESELVKQPTPPAAAAFRALLGYLRSPSELLAPTPVNTPLIFDVGMVEQVGRSATAVCSEQMEECQLNRALLFDSPEKSDVSTTSSSLTFQDSPCRPAADDFSSVQANPSLERARDVVAAAEEEECFHHENMDEEDDLWEGLRNLSVTGEKKDDADNEKKNGGSPAFAGKHIRFVYDSDGELEREEEDVVVPSNVVVLNGRHGDSDPSSNEASSNQASALPNKQEQDDDDH